MTILEMYQNGMTPDEIAKRLALPKDAVLREIGFGKPTPNVKPRSVRSLMKERAEAAAAEGRRFTRKPRISIVKTCTMEGNHRKMLRKPATKKGEE